MSIDVSQDPTAGKHGGNSESNAAWETKAKWTACKSRRSIVEALHANGPATVKELSVIMGKPMHHISGRIMEIVEMGLVYKTDIVRDGGRVIAVVEDQPYSDDLLDRFFGLDKG